MFQNFPTIFEFYRNLAFSKMAPLAKAMLLIPGHGTEFGLCVSCVGWRLCSGTISITIDYDGCFRYERVSSDVECAHIFANYDFPLKILKCIFRFIIACLIKPPTAYDEIYKFEIFEF